MPDRHALKSAGRDLLTRIEAAMEQVDWESFMAFSGMLPRARRTFVAGAGRSGLVARSFGMRLMHAGLPAFAPGGVVLGSLLPGHRSAATTSASAATRVAPKSSTTRA